MIVRIRYQTAEPPNKATQARLRATFHREKNTAVRRLASIAFTAYENNAADGYRAAGHGSVGRDSVHEWRVA